MRILLPLCLAFICMSLCDGIGEARASDDCDIALYPFDKTRMGNDLVCLIAVKNFVYMSSYPQIVKPSHHEDEYVFVSPKKYNYTCSIKNPTLDRNKTIEISWYQDGHKHRDSSTSFFLKDGQVVLINHYPDSPPKEEAYLIKDLPWCH